MSIHTRMGKRMDYILVGIIVEKLKEKELTRLGNKMDYGLGGMKMDR